MSLPKIVELEFDTNEEQSVIQPDVHATFDWDFTTGDFKLINGKLIKLTGIEYLKVWIQKALYTVRGTLIYKDTNYGSEHHNLIGKSFKRSYAQAEFERMIRETLLQNDAISDVVNFVFAQKGSRISIEFDVISIYGTTRGDVII